MIIIVISHLPPWIVLQYMGETWNENVKVKEEERQRERKRRASIKKREKRQKNGKIILWVMKIENTKKT